MAMAAVIVTNIEATLLTLRLSEWRADAASIFNADLDSQGDRGRGG